MNNYSFVLSSSNAKTGPIPVTMTDKDSCPSTCPLKGNGCYAESGNVNIHWSRLSKKNRLTIDELCSNINGLPNNQLWRHNSAGDLPGNDDSIDSTALYKLIKANKGKRGFTYTHKYTDTVQRADIRFANANGFTINLSANNLEHADMLSDYAIGPVVAIVPHNFDDRTPKYTPAGRKVKVCPAVRSDDITCAKCGLCQVANRDFIIAFPAHGTRKAVAERVTNNA